MKYVRLMNALQLYVAVAHLRTTRARELRRGLPPGVLASEGDWSGARFREGGKSMTGASLWWTALLRFLCGLRVVRVITVRVKLEGTFHMKFSC